MARSRARRRQRVFALVSTHGALILPLAGDHGNNGGSSSPFRRCVPLAPVSFHTRMFICTCWSLAK